MLFAKGIVVINEINLHVTINEIIYLHVATNEIYLPCCVETGLLRYPASISAFRAPRFDLYPLCHTAPHTQTHSVYSFPMNTINTSQYTSSNGRVSWKQLSHTSSTVFLAVA